MIDTTWILFNFWLRDVFKAKHILYTAKIYVYRIWPTNLMSTKDNIMKLSEHPFGIQLHLHVFLFGLDLSRIFMTILCNSNMKMFFFFVITANIKLIWIVLLREFIHPWLFKPFYAFVYLSPTKTFQYCEYTFSNTDFTYKSVWSKLIVNTINLNVNVVS